MPIHRTTDSLQGHDHVQVHHNGSHIPPQGYHQRPASPPAAYDTCKGCHGIDGKIAALGKSAVIGGQDKEALITSMNEYKAGTKNVSGMGALMKGQVASMSEEDIEAVAEYLSQL